jgi:adenylate kinase
MYIIMLGAPGSGKGTIGRSICEEFKLEYVSTGDIFREELSQKTELGIKAQEYMDKGELVPDEITIAMVTHKLDQLDNALLDGFPRTIAQAESLRKYLNEKSKAITDVINLEVPDKDIIKRTSSRVICSNKDCGASYNTIFMPSKKPGICDNCGSELIKRKDDEPEIIEARLVTYHEITEPLINYYKEQGIIDSIQIDIYSPTTREDTTKASIDSIKARI